MTHKQYNEYFKFTVIRNPWERAYSWYKGVMRDESMKKKSSEKPTIHFLHFLEFMQGKGNFDPKHIFLKALMG